MNKKRIIIGLLIILWMGLIFNFSAQSKNDSAALSGGLTEDIMAFLITDFDQLSVLEQQTIVAFWHNIIRKCAHLSLYCMLGFLLAMFWQGIKHQVLYSLLVGLLYAISDEVHQAFVPGRGPQITDVGIDFCGVFLGVLFCFLLFSLWEKYSGKAGNRHVEKE